MTIETPADRYGPLTLALRGEHQVGNALVAVRLLEAARATRASRVAARRDRARPDATPTGRRGSSCSRSPTAGRCCSTRRTTPTARARWPPTCGAGTRSGRRSSSASCATRTSTASCAALLPVASARDRDRRADAARAAARPSSRARGRARSARPRGVVTSSRRPARGRRARRSTRATRCASRARSSSPAPFATRLEAACYPAVIPRVVMRSLRASCVPRVPVPSCVPLGAGAAAAPPPRRRRQRPRLRSSCSTVATVASSSRSPATTGA